MLRALAVAAMVAASACNDAGTNDATAPTAAETPRAGFEMSARILGPVANDAASDLRITLRETEGVGGRINFMRLTCSNRSTQEWGAGTFASDRGSNRIEAREEVVLERGYRCGSSARPAELLADITDDFGLHHEVRASPVHPDWPGA